MAEAGTAAVRPGETAGPDIETAQRHEEIAILTGILKKAGDPEAHQNARTLLHAKGSFLAVLREERNVLQCANNLSIEAVTEISRARRLVDCATSSRVIGRQILDTPETLEAYCVARLEGLACEELHLLSFNRRNELLDSQCIQRGIVDHVTVYARQIAGLAISVHATSIVLAHNHPGGKAEPGWSDRQVTDRLIPLLRTLSIELHDHIIVAGGAAFSMRREGLIGERPETFSINPRSAAG